MPRTGLYPLKLESRLHIKVWGGQRLKSHLGKALPTEDPYGESWELHDSATVLNGPLAGKTLGALAETYGSDLLGSESSSDDGFPLLAKFIDSERWLSVQVHPNDEQALLLEGEPRGKTEAWIILHAERDAQIVNGLRPGMTKSQVAQAIASNQLEAILIYTPVAAGDVIYMPANTIHALGPGILVYEIQQSSDTTYRLYDWGRMGLDGAPRPLHIEKGLQVADLKLSPRVGRPNTDCLVDGEYFSIFRHHLRGDRTTIESGSRFHALTCVSGHARVESSGHDAITLATGDTVLIPACIDAFTLAGQGIILRSFSKPAARSR